MRTKYPRGMTFTQWRRTPYRTKYWLVGLALNDLLGHWRSCDDNRCRRARSCQDYRCYWRRKQKMSEAEAAAAHTAGAPLRAMLQIGSSNGSEGLWLY